MPLGVNFRCVGVELWTLGVVARPLEVDFRTLRLNFRPLRAVSGLKKIDVGPLCSDNLGSGGEIHSYLT